MSSKLPVSSAVNFTPVTNTQEDNPYVVKLEKGGSDGYPWDTPIFNTVNHSMTGVLSDLTIEYLVDSGRMEISPFHRKQVKEENGQRIISYGLSSYGYDVRVADEFKIFTNVNSTLVDPKNFDEKTFVYHKGPYCIVPPNSFVLARTVERLRIPRDVLTMCVGKSTIARTGLDILVTPLEPEWEGYVTLEFANSTPLPVKLYANEGCAQILFFRGNLPCRTSYKDRGGKYMDQGPEIILPRLKD